MDKNENLELIQNNINTLRMILVLMAYYVHEMYCMANRRWWVRSINSTANRRNNGAYYTLHSFFRMEDHESFFQYMRMPVSTFGYLYEKLRIKLTKSNTAMRDSLSPELRLAAVLVFLAQGKSVKYHAWVERIGESTLYKLIPEVCSAIIEVLQPEYVAFPSENDWRTISQKFFEEYGLPHCVGAVDGKHIRVFNQPHAGSYFFNYKRYFSIILMACCDTFRRFIWANVGCPGSQNDSTVFRFSDLGVALANQTADLPPDEIVPQTDIRLPYYFLGDGGFPLARNLMVPFVKTRNFPRSEEKFNKRLSSARQLIECSFGILSGKWKILQQSMNFKLETTKSIVMALICLHNFIITQELAGHIDRSYSSNNTREPFEVPLDNVLLQPEDEPDAGGIEIRKLLTLYVNSPQGVVHRT